MTSNQAGGGNRLAEAQLVGSLPEAPRHHQVGWLRSSQAGGGNRMTEAQLFGSLPEASRYYQVGWLRRNQPGRGNLKGFRRHLYNFQKGTCEGPEIGGPEVDDPGTSTASGATVGGMTPGRVTQEKHSVKAKWAELGQAGCAWAGLADRRPD